MDNMLPVNISSPQAILHRIGANARAMRVAADWSRKTLSSRSGVPESTIKRFELTGNIGLKPLIQISLALDAAEEFSRLFPAKQIVSIDEVLAPKRQRGRQ